MKRLIFAALAACALISSGCSKDFDNSTVSEFDLSRTPVPDPDLLEMVLDEAEERGYDTSELIWVDQSRNIAQWEKENAE